MTEQHAETLPRALDGLVQDAMAHAGKAWAMADELAKAQADLATAQDWLSDAKVQIQTLEHQLRGWTNVSPTLAPPANPLQLAQDGSIKLTLTPDRMLLAGMAMQGMLAQSAGDGDNYWEDVPDKLAKRAKEHADALIKALEGGAG